MTTPSEDYDNVYGTFFDYYYDYENNSVVELCYTAISEHVYHLSLVYPIIAVLGLLDNLLVIVIYALYKKTKSRTDVYLLNIAVADLLFVLALPFIVYNEQNNWVMGDGACKILNGAYSLNLYSGVLLLGCISIDRYVTIVLTSRAQHLPSLRRILVYRRAICFVVWIMALLISLPMFIYSTTDLPQPEIFLLDENSDIPEDREQTRECVIYFNTAEAANHMSILIPSLQMAIGFILPLMVIVFCYICIISTLLKAHNFHNQKTKEWLVLTVVLVFIICHLPYNITRIVNIITMREEKECSSEITMQVVLSITEALAYMHCCLNPILYAFSGVCFRRHFRKFLSDIGCVGRDYMPAQHNGHEHDGFDMGNHRILPTDE